MTEEQEGIKNLITFLTWLQSLYVHELFDIGWVRALTSRRNYGKHSYVESLQELKAHFQATYEAVQTWDTDNNLYDEGFVAGTLFLRELGL